MGRNGSYNQIHHHRNISTSSSCSTTTKTPTTTFLPLLCRISNKDVVDIPQTSSCPKKNDPSSPKVSCMGQIKRHNTNNINPTTTGKIRYTQLKKIFSGRNLLITTTTTTRSTCNSKIEISDRRRKPKFDNYSSVVVAPLNLDELDPPLPVVKLPCRRREEGGSLWKRRGGGAPLGGLQIQHIQLPNNNITLLLQPPSSVS